jgi:coenzyme A diphosphatase NUDT7
LLKEIIKKLHNRKANILGHEHAMKTAVLLPLVEIENNTFLLFEKRSLNLKHQPGEICFPGGKMDSADCDLQATAIRETCEELGITPNNIEILGELDTLVAPSNLIIYSFIANIKNVNYIKANPSEVDKVLYIPLKYLLETKPLEHEVILKPELTDNFPLFLIPQGANYPFRKNRIMHYFYIWEEEVIWGLTARILNHFISLLKDSPT